MNIDILYNDNIIGGKNIKKDSKGKEKDKAGKAGKAMKAVKKGSKEDKAGKKGSKEDKAGKVWKVGKVGKEDKVGNLGNIGNIGNIGKDAREPRNIYETHEYILEPIKVIYQTRNNNNKKIYNMYIYVGELGLKYKDIFNKIKELDIYNTLLKVSKDENSRLVKGFGEYWVIKFFNKYHVSAFINKLEKVASMKKEIINKYGDTWVSNFITKFKTDVVFRKVNYSYSELINVRFKNSMGKKLEKLELEKEDIEDLDFANEISKKSSNILYQMQKLDMQDGPNVYSGGGDDGAVEGGWDGEGGGAVEGEGEEEEEDIVDIVDIEQEIDTTNDLGEEEDLNYEEIEKLYQTEDIDKNVEETKTLIADILDDDIDVKQKKYLIEFNNSKDEDIENENLEQVYIKNFVYTFYIFKDDNIKMVKNKITCSIKNNSKFGKYGYIVPSRMYMWAEYIVKGKIDKIAIGHRWMKKNELLNIDIEPIDLGDYENLEVNLKKLKDTMKRYTGRIRKEDEENNILYDYNDYILNDELYLIDIYNELGLNYSPSQEKLDNVIDTYIKIYFPKIRQDDIKGIIEYLNGDTKIELGKIQHIFNTIFNDMVLEKEIMDLVETIKIGNRKEYLDLFSSGNFITQSDIHVHLDIHDEELEKENLLNKTKIGQIGLFSGILIPRLDLFRIFNDFVPDDDYPFIQYQVPDGQIIFKYYDAYMAEFTKTNNNVEMITKWFENSPYGISFKVRLENDNFMAININDIGKVEYKTQWKETDFANIYDVIDTYEYVKDLVVRINKTLKYHPYNISIRVPDNWEFNFAFINCIQKFKLPDNKIINHNDLSEFSRYFFPYISLVIDPPKRVSKGAVKDEKGKYGTYLRYKRDSKYDIISKVEQRILTYLKNSDLNDDDIADEVAKQFNITISKAKEEIDKIKTKIPNIAKNKKFGKGSDVMPKVKVPGIGIDIQGKIPEKYKIRISGARNQDQLERIISFMNILIYLYAETYIIKNPKMQILKEKLKKLTNVAKRRSKVDGVVNYEKDVKDIKQMSLIDKKRLGFKPDKGHNQWSRACQNSGNDKKRRPQLNVQSTIHDLIKKGYVLNKKTGEYEKKILIASGKKKEEIILKALRVTITDEATNMPIDGYYSCNPTDNGSHTYVGFLTKSNNPFGECMPCCFKKDPLIKKQKDKIEFYKRCLSGEKKDTLEASTVGVGDILYILQDTNKIQEERLGYLPKYIDLITNFQFNTKKKIKNHYLLSTSGYYFKMGIKQEDYSFLNTLSIVLGISIKEIKEIIIEFFKKDTDEMYYTSLNDGDIKTEFKINDFINFINETEHIDYYYLKDIIKIEGLFTKRGILPFTFIKHVTIIKKGIEKEKIKEDFILDIDEQTLVDSKYYLSLFDTKDVLILLKSEKFYYPIVKVFKESETAKEIRIKKLFTEDDKTLIIEIRKFLERSINDISTDFLKTNISAKEAYSILKDIKNKDFEVIGQTIDTRYKCRYLITKNSTIIPVIPSGIILDIPIICFNENNNINDCFSKIKFNNIDTMNKYLEEVYKISSKFINVKPIGLFYDLIHDDIVNVIGIITSNNDLVPVQQVKIPLKELEENKVLIQNRPLYHKLDVKLATYDKENIGVIDERIKNINLKKFINESYELFKFEISNLLTSKKYSKEKQELKDLINKKDIDKVETFILHLCISKLNDKIISKNNIVGPELVTIVKSMPNVENYKINNQRIICNDLDQNKCIVNNHCTWANSKCSFALTDVNLFNFVRKLSYELVEIEIRKYEIFKEKRYYISDIVDYNNFTERQGQKIIKSNSTNINKSLKELFNTDHIPKIGKRHISKKIEIDLQQLQLENPLKDIKDAFTQIIIPYNYSIIRAYINGYYWNKHELYTSDIRNLGYYSEMQNELINLFRSMIIDWLNIPSNITKLLECSDKEKEIINNKIMFINNIENKNNDKVKGIINTENRLVINKYIIGLIENNKENNMGLFELFILNKIHNIPIVLLINGIVKYFINKGHINKYSSNDEENEKLLNSNNICINMNFGSNLNYPNVVNVIYHKL